MRLQSVFDFVADRIRRDAEFEVGALESEMAEKLGEPFFQFDAKSRERQIERRIGMANQRLADALIGMSRETPSFEKFFRIGRAKRAGEVA